MSDQPLELLRFFQLWLVGILLTFLAQSLGLLIGAASDIKVIFNNYTQFVPGLIFLCDISDGNLPLTCDINSNAPVFRLLCAGG